MKLVSIMNNLLKSLLAIAILSAISACSAPHSDLKSPCVGATKSPCDRRPVNDWWLNNNNDNS